MTRRSVILIFVIKYFSYIWLDFVVFFLLGPYIYSKIKVNESDVKPGICLVTPRRFNIQTRHGFKNFCLFSSNSTYSVQNQVIYFPYVYNCVYSL